MITFSCPRCETLLQQPNELASSKVQCPGCGQRLKVPELPASESPTIVGKLVMPASRTSAPDDTIRCVCPHCQAIIKAPSKAAGAKAPCPRCSLLVEIPVPKAGYVEEPVTVIPARQFVPPIAPTPATLPLPEPPPMPARNPATNQQNQRLLPLICSNCQTTVYVPSESTQAVVPCPRCSLLINATLPSEHTPRRDAPVVVNVINNNDGHEGKRAPTRSEQVIYKGSSSSGGLAPAALILLFIVAGFGGVAIFAWHIYESSSDRAPSVPGVNQRELRVQHLDKEMQEYQSRASEAERVGDQFAQRKYLELALKKLEELERELRYIISAQEPGSDARKNWDKRLVLTERNTEATRELIASLKRMGF